MSTFWIGLSSCNGKQDNSDVYSYLPVVHCELYQHYLGVLLWIFSLENSLVRIFLNWNHTDL